MKEFSPLKKIGANFQYFLYFILFCGADAFVYPYLNLYFAWRGLDGTEIGLINSLSYIFTVVAGFVYGTIADKSGRPKTLLLIGILGSALSIFWLSLSQTMICLCLASVLYTFHYVPSGDLGDKLMLDRLGAEDTRLFSLFRLGGPIGYGAGVLVAGAITAASGIVPVFYGGMLVFAAAFVTVLCMPSSPKQGKKAARAPVGQVLAHKHASYFYGVMALWGFVESGSLPYLSVYMDGQGFGAEYTAVLISVAMAGQMIGYLFTPVILKRVREGTLVGAGFLFMVLRIGALVWVKQIPAPIMIMTQLVGGLSQPFLLATMTQMIGENYRGGASNTAQTLKTVANRGIGGSVGVFLFGWLYSRLSAPSVMALFTGFSLAAGLLTLCWSRKLKA